MGARRPVPLLAPPVWSLSSEHWGIKQIFYNPLVLAASFCTPGGGTPQPVGDRSTLGGPGQGVCPEKVGSSFWGRVWERRLRKGSGQQKPLGIQCQLLPTLALDVTNVLSMGARVVTDGVHPSISLKREAHARGCGCPALPGSLTAHWWKCRGRSAGGGAPGALLGPGIFCGDCVGLRMPGTGSF